MPPISAESSFIYQHFQSMKKHCNSLAWLSEDPFEPLPKISRLELVSAISPNPATLTVSVGEESSWANEYSAGESVLKKHFVDVLRTRTRFVQTRGDVSCQQITNACHMLVFSTLHLNLFVFSLPLIFFLLVINGLYL